MNNSNCLHRICVGAFVLASAILCFSNRATSAPINLGQAGGYAAFILPGGSSINMTINGGAAVNGDVAAAAGMHIDLGGGAKVGITAGTDNVVSGKIYLDPDPVAATVKLNGQDPNSVASGQLEQAVADAIAANQFYGGLPVTENLGNLDVTSPFTITGNGGVNVISVTDFKLHGDDGLLTLQGSAADCFIINLTGTYTQSGKSNVQLAGGVRPENVLWNFIGSGNGANIGASGQVTYGIFLSPERDFNMTDTTLYGSVISQGHLGIQSQALVVNVVPDVAPTWALFVCAGLVLVVGSRRGLPLASLVVKRK